MDFHQDSEKAAQKQFIDSLNIELDKLLTNPSDSVEITVNNNGVGIRPLRHGTLLHTVYVCMAASAVATARLDQVYAERGYPKEVFPAVLGVFMSRIVENFKLTGLKVGNLEEFHKAMGLKPKKPNESSDKGEQK